MNPSVSVSSPKTGVYNLDVEASGRSLGSVTNSVAKPLSAKRIAQVILRRKVLHPDNRMFSLIYTLQDEDERTRVDAQGLKVQATVGNGPSTFSCSLPDGESGVGECANLEVEIPRRCI